MPRPGPRPYECIRRAWHSDSHQPLRGTLIHEIFRLVNEVHSNSTRRKKEWQEKLPIVVLRAEEILYSKANSESEYGDVETLRSRLDDAVDTMIRREDGEEEGLYLLPCVEAALSLGCMPKKTPRSQRQGTSRHLNATRPVGPAVRSAGDDCSTGMGYTDYLCFPQAMQTSSALGLMTQALPIQDQSFQSASCMPNSLFGTVGPLWVPHPCHPLDTSHSIMAHSTPIPNTVDAHCTVGISPYPKQGALVQFLRETNVGGSAGNLLPDVAHYDVNQSPSTALQEFGQQQIFDPVETIGMRMGSRFFCSQPVVCQTGNRPLLTIPRLLTDDGGSDGHFSGNRGAGAKHHNSLVPALPKNSSFFERENKPDAERCSAPVDGLLVTSWANNDVSLIPSWCKSDAASNAVTNLSAKLSTSKTSTASLLGDPDLQLRLGPATSEPSGMPGSRLPLCDVRILPARSVPVHQAPPIKRTRVDVFNQSTIQIL